MTATVSIAGQDDLDAFREAVRDFLAARAPREHVRQVIAAGGVDSSATWTRAAREIGVQGLLIPETLGGAGAPPGVAAVAIGELGAALTVGPFLPTLVGSDALAASGQADAAAAIAAGEAKVALDFATLKAPIAVERTGPSSVVLDAAALRVPDVLDADILLVGVTSESASGLAIIRTDDRAVAVKELRSIDLTRPVGRVAVNAATAPFVQDGGDLLARAGDLAALLLASEQIGIIDRVLRDDVAYLLDREAFGRKAGSFQAVKHQLAQIYCHWEQAVALHDHALAVFERPAERTHAVDALQCFVAPAAVTATTVGLRLLGGIGFTWEHDAHLYFRRARADESMLENIHVRRSRLAGSLGLRTPVSGDDA
ncbi:acyl-CoA dehydrogenase family protein [Rhodococcus sp. T7]|uniref:acyl-CoA dehydrogenase family protein n=1 Tax=Rhodococcus sp. T7 TaxID=627444 RepID=UPI001356EBDC|nr:acyl-CoA dehydrogenase family protein [Rhodococcus sp. T7]KAF0957131.1 hypothetical protein MLGJGCBP_08961 [Rhodococcus sp. T7]KAF0958856.1 hypothetical protein MLGJGCBP_08050 [Rhodococcus sp. T7]